MILIKPIFTVLALAFFILTVYELRTGKAIIHSHLMYFDKPKQPIGYWALIVLHAATFTNLVFFLALA